MDAAIEYVKLGKTQRALTIYAHVLAAVTSATPTTISDEVRVSLFLHYAETMAVNGLTEKRSVDETMHAFAQNANALCSSNLYEEARSLAQKFESQPSRSTAARIRTRVLMLERSALASKVFSAIQVSQVCCCYDTLCPILRSIEGRPALGVVDSEAVTSTME